jgi:hypothetical protein
MLAPILVIPISRDISRSSPFKIPLVKNWAHEGTSQKATAINKSGVSILNQLDKKEEVGSNTENRFVIIFNSGKQLDSIAS